MQLMRNRLLFTCLALAGLPGIAAAAASGLTATTPFAGTATGDLISVIQTIINVFLGLVALVAAFYIVLGGLKYITSSGDESKAEEGKNTLIYAVIGLIVIGISAVLVNFVLVAIKGG